MTGNLNVGESKPPDLAEIDESIGKINGDDGRVGQCEGVMCNIHFGKTKTV